MAGQQEQAFRGEYIRDWVHKAVSTPRHWGKNLGLLLTSCLAIRKLLRFSVPSLGTERKECVCSSSSPHVIQRIQFNKAIQRVYSFRYLALGAQLNWEGSRRGHLPLGEEVNVIQTNHPAQDMVKAQKPSKKITRGQPGSWEPEPCGSKFAEWDSGSGTVYQHISWT